MDNYKNNLPRILAMYLPQFHRIPENDAWWGEGFTEWTAVKAAKPLFKGHDQPRIPLNKNYYDLMDKKTMQWQAKLMHKYGIDGMCMYHYYFKNGKKVLEKPAENLLKWKDIDMPFCFSWANETWARSWSKLNRANTWSESFETSKIQNAKNDNGILLEQDYGDKTNWRKHYKYLSSFFKDNRYIKVDNKPVLVIYSPKDIVCLHEMKEFFDGEAVRDGFEGIYLIGTGCDINNENEDFSALMVRAPGDILKIIGQVRYDNIYNVGGYYQYADACNLLAKFELQKKQCPSCFVGYDETPRRDRASAIIDGRNPKIFERTIEQVILKGQKNNSPFVFINAWNEWGEGNYLEPDERFGYAFLEAVKAAKENVIAGNVRDESENPQNKIDVLTKENTSLKNLNERYRNYWQILDKMLCMTEDGLHINLSRFGLCKSSSVMIYGCGMIGKHLLYLMRKSDIYVVSAD